MGSIWNQHWGPYSWKTQVLPALRLHLMWGQEESSGLLLILVLGQLAAYPCFDRKLLFILVLGQLAPYPCFGSTSRREVDAQECCTLWDWPAISKSEGILLDSGYFAACGMDFWNIVLHIVFLPCTSTCLFVLQFGFPWLQIHLVCIFVLFEKYLTMGSAPPLLCIYNFESLNPKNKVDQVDDASELCVQTETLTLVIAMNALRDLTIFFHHLLQFSSPVVCTSVHRPRTLAVRGSRVYLHR